MKARTKDFMARPEAIALALEALARSPMEMRSLGQGVSQAWMRHHEATVARVERLTRRDGKAILPRDNIEVVIGVDDRGIRT